MVAERDSISYSPDAEVLDPNSVEVRFGVRNSQPMSLYRSEYIRNRSEEHTKYFPKPRPVHVA